MSLTAAEARVVARRARVYPKGVDTAVWFAPSGLG